MGEWAEAFGNTEPGWGASGGRSGCRVRLVNRDSGETFRRCDILVLYCVEEAAPGTPSATPSFVMSNNLCGDGKNVWAVDYAITDREDQCQASGGMPLAGSRLSERVQ